MKILASPLHNRMNPYIFQFYDSLKKQDSTIEIKQYSQKNIFTKSDICHFHWPESALHEPKALKRFKLIIMFFLEVYFLKAKKVKIIWTVHNLRPHERSKKAYLEKIFYKHLVHLIDGFIFLSNSTKDEFFLKFPKNKPYSIIPHGHYKDVYKNIEPSRKFRKKFNINEGDLIIGHYGLIRNYKNIPNLIKSFKELKAPNLKLIIAGGVTKERQNVADEIDALAKDDSRIKIHYAFLENNEMLELYSLTNLTIFPYKDIVNSGSALLSLSLACPTVLPKNQFMKELKNTINTNKIFLFEGEFSSKAITEALNDHNLIDNEKKDIDLNMLNWELIGKSTYNFFKSLCT